MTSVLFWGLLVDRILKVSLIGSETVLNSGRDAEVVGQEVVRNTVDFQCTGINFTLGINILVIMFILPIVWILYQYRFAKGNPILLAGQNKAKQVFMKIFFLQ